MPKKAGFTFFFFFWMAAISVLSLAPMDDIDLGGPEIPFMDKWVHMGFYLIAMVLGALFAWERFRHGIRKKTALLWMAAALVIYGMIIEVLQGSMGMDRSAEWGDLAANILGIGLGGWLAAVLFRKRESLNWPD